MKARSEHIKEDSNRLKFSGSKYRISISYAHIVQSHTFRHTCEDSCEWWGWREMEKNANEHNKSPGHVIIIYFFGNYYYRRYYILQIAVSRSKEKKMKHSVWLECASNKKKRTTRDNIVHMCMTLSTSCITYGSVHELQYMKNGDFACARLFVRWLGKTMKIALRQHNDKAIAIQIDSMAIFLNGFEPRIMQINRFSFESAGRASKIKRH